jgi:hypothetical protein
MRTSKTRALAGALVVTVAGSLTACEPDPVRSTLQRPADPVVLTGSDVPALAGTAPGRLVAFRASSDGWTQVPVQVDERLDTTMANVYGLPPTQTFYGSSIDVPVNVYADPGTFVGPDPDTTIDADDELVFMARDAGGEAGDVAAPPGTAGTGVEVQLDDPDDPDGTGYVYLFGSDGSLDPSAGQQYVDYDFRLLSGDYKTTYKRTDGPNPEDSTVTGATYTAHTSDRWLMDSITLTHGSKPGVDLVDRMKYDIPVLCLRNENTFNDEEGAFVVNRSGPVRALRSYVGANSGPNTQNTHAFYDMSVESTVDLRVHTIPTVGAHLDLNAEASGMTLRDPAIPDGVLIDGVPESPPQTEPTWWTVSGPQGGLAASAVYDTDAAEPASRWYEDDTTPANWQCTGDGQAIGDTGAVSPAVACTDPGLGCTQHFSVRYRIVAMPAGLAPSQLQEVAEHGLRPLTVTVRSR